MNDAGTTPSSTGPASDPLKIEMTERGSTVVVTVSGMAAVQVAGQLTRALQEAAAKKPALLAVDLSGLSFISSTGLGGIVAAHVTCRKSGTRMCLLSPKPFIREMLNVTKLSSLFEIYDSLADAEERVGPG